MAIIKCTECGKDISNKAKQCVYCGCPVKQSSQQGKAVFQTSNDFIGLLGKYIIKDSNGKIVAKLKANDYFEINLTNDEHFAIKYSGAFSSPQKVTASANRLNRYMIGLSNGGVGFYVRQI